MEGGGSKGKMLGEKQQDYNRIIKRSHKKLQRKAVVTGNKAYKNNLALRFAA